MHRMPHPPDAEVTAAHHPGGPPEPPRLPLEVVAVTRTPGGAGHDEVAEEAPLQIKVEGRPVAITLRSPGQDLDLTAGFLWTEGVIDGPDDLVALATIGENVVDVRLAEGVPAARSRAADRALFTSSSCGVCGKETLDRLARRLPPLPGAPTPTAEQLFDLPAALGATQSAWGRTGGVHAAALFPLVGPSQAVDLRFVREDVGRHNAVDKVLGACLRSDTLDLHGLGLIVTSRAGFEIVQKAWAARVAVLVTLGPPTSLAIDAAIRANIQLYGWLRADRFTRYA